MLFKNIINKMTLKLKWLFSNLEKLICKNMFQDTYYYLQHTNLKFMCIYLRKES